MAIVYVSPGLGTGANDGSSAANAFQSWAAFATAGCAAGSDVRVNADENSTSAVALTGNINGVFGGPTTITGYDATWTTPTLRFRNGTGAGANIDGFSLNTLSYVTFSYIEAKNYTRDGFRDVTAACTGMEFKNCSSHNNTAIGFGIVNFAGAVYLKFINCVSYSNGTVGISVRNTLASIRRCLIYNNATGVAVAAATICLAFDCIIHSNSITGVVTSTTNTTVLKNCIIDRNAVGITVSSSTARHQIIQCRITNNTTTGLTIPTGVGVDVVQSGWYISGAQTKFVLTGTGVCTETSCVNMAADGYVNGATGNYNLINGATPAECRWTAAGVGDTTNNIYWTAGLSSNPDFPAVGNTRDTDSSDGATGTLPSNKILKSNSVGSGAGNYNDDNLSVANVRPVAFGVEQTGDLSGLLATDAAFVTLEDGRNSGATAAKILTGQSVVQKGVTINGSGGGGSTPAPSAPVIAATVISSTKVRLTISTFGANAATHQPKYKLVGGAYQNFGSTINTHTVDITGLTAGQDYVFKVTATNDTSSTDSNEVSASTNDTADCISALITQNLVDAEAAVTTANGYNTNVAYCEQERLTDRKNDRLPMVVVAGPYQNFDADAHTRGTRDTLAYTLFYEARLDDRILTDDAISKQARNIAADMVKGFMLDRTRNGYAINTQPREAFYTVDYTNDDAPTFLVVVSLEVETIIDAENPYQIG